MTMGIHETERSSSSHHHHHRTHGSELFVCFTSRPSSASIKLAPSSSTKASSSSMLSPGRAEKIRENPANRRLKSSGSIKGQSSPMLFATGKKRNGSSFETQEPTSPKVTCIGQVRVKTKQGKKMMKIGRVNGLGGELSFSKREHQGHEDCLPPRNQHWGHMFGFRKEVSFSICDAIREFTCFLPCTSNSGGYGKTSMASTAGTDGNKEKETACGVAFAKWLMVCFDGDEKRMRGEDVPVVVDGPAQRESMVVEEEDDREEIGQRRLRAIGQSRDTEVCFNESMKKYDEEEEDVAVPPRNALLLMRCRSDPVRMAALASRFWDSPVVEPRPEAEEEDENSADDLEEVEDEERESLQGNKEEELVMVTKKDSEDEEGEEIEVTDDQKDCDEFLHFHETHTGEGDETVVTDIEQRAGNEEEEDDRQERDEGEVLEYQVMSIKEECQQNEILHELTLEIVGITDISLSLTDTKDDLELLVKEEEEQTEHPPALKAEKVEDDEESKEIRQSFDSLNPEESNQDKTSTKDEESEQCLDTDEAAGITVFHDEDREQKEDATDNKAVSESIQHEEEDVEEDDESMIVVKDRLDDEKKEREDEESEKPLPDCLLLMMYEPKLSMEVSEETWVCSRDFLWHRPKRQERKPQQQGGKEREEEKERNCREGEKRRVSTDERTQKRSPSMAKLIEQKLVNAYEPFVLTRCKSEPLRSTNMSVVPEACFWKTKKLCKPYLGMGF